jgi:hypothetical protein
MGKLGPTVFETDVAQPDEEFAITVDFFSRLKTGETISTVAVTALDKAGVAQAGVLNGTATIQAGRAASSEVLQNVHNLVDGERYNIQMLATTSAATAQILEADVYIPVKKIAISV